MPEAQTYLYADAWQATVDRNGEAWRHYCLAKSLVRRYLTVRLQQGNAAAKTFWDSEAEAYGLSRQAIWEQLCVTARQIYIHEGEAMAAQLLRTLQTAAPDPSVTAQASTHAVS